MTARSIPLSSLGRVFGANLAAQLATNISGQGRASRRPAARSAVAKAERQRAAERAPRFNPADVATRIATGSEALLATPPAKRVPAPRYRQTSPYAVSGNASHIADTRPRALACAITAVRAGRTVAIPTRFLATSSSCRRTEQASDTVAPLPRSGRPRSFREGEPYIGETVRTLLQPRANHRP